MRKKSHIGLARYLTNYKHQELLASHRYFFYAGSILPDCRPSFLTTRHNIESTLPLIQEYMERVRLHRIRTADTYLNRRDCITIGQEISLVRGETVRHGTAVDVDGSGALLVEFSPGLVEAVNSGEVSIRGLYGYV